MLEWIPFSKLFLKRQKGYWQESKMKIGLESE